MVRNVLYVGDSIMGQAPSRGYIHSLANWIYNQDSTSRHHFLNIGGNSSADVLKRIKSETEARLREGVRAFVISVGLVDSGFYDPEHPEISLTEYTQNIGFIFDIALGYTKNIVVPGLSRVDPAVRRPKKRNYDNTRTHEFDMALQGISESKGAVYIPINDLLTPKDLVDGVHPNIEGHQKIFNRIIKRNLSFLLDSPLGVKKI